MLVIGRVTSDALVKQTKSGREVLEFSIAVNDWYKPKGEEQVKKTTTFFNCSYWINPKLGDRLKKASLVEIFGRVTLNFYNDTYGAAKGSLRFHVTSIKNHFAKKQVSGSVAYSEGHISPTNQPSESFQPLPGLTTGSDQIQAVDDLPF
jgi:single-strand DNA-binding protein